MHLFIYFALLCICITTYCIFCCCCRRVFICTMLMCMCSRISLPLSSHHESGCCSVRVKSGGQQRKAICLLRLRAKLCC